MDGATRPIVPSFTRTARLKRCTRLAAALLLCGGCVDRAPTLPGAAVSECRYAIEPRAERELVLDVTARCRGPRVTGLALSRPELGDAVTVLSTSAPLERRGTRFVVEPPRPLLIVRYRVELERAFGEHPELGLRAGSSVLAPASSFLLHPLPLEVETAVIVEATSSLPFATALERRGGHYRLAAHEIPVASYAAFGRFTTIPLELPDEARLELVLLDGPAPDRGLVRSWGLASARAVVDFYGRFPGARATVFVVPVPARAGTLDGVLLPESAPGIVVHVGAESGAESFAADWILIHELFHLGVPSFRGEGRWFDEGLAVYFGPILRVRAGLLDEQALWEEFAREMPPGLEALAQRGLVRARSGNGAYWGGAALCLLADLEIRTDSGGKIGLEDGIRRLHASGAHASEVVPLDRALALSDQAFPRPVLRPLAARFARKTSPPDLSALFARLGVMRDEAGRIVLDDDAELAPVRRAIVHGN